MEVHLNFNLKNVKNEIEDIGYIYIKSFYDENSRSRVIFYYDSNGYKHSSSLGNIRKHKGKIRIVSNSNIFSDYNARKWVKENRKGFLVSPNQKITNASEKNQYFHKKCGEVFISSFTYIKSKKFGCPVCAGKQVGKYNNLAYLRPDIAKEWDYDKNEKNPEEYAEKSGKSVWWLCSKCGESWNSRIADRSSGQGCPKCRMSHGEKEISRFLKYKKIKFKSQYKFKNCKNKRELPFDFYLPDYNLCIEYHGEQHYREVRGNFFGERYGLEDRIKKDKIKEKYCKDNNIELLVIPYTKFKIIDKIILGFLEGINNE